MIDVFIPQEGVPAMKIGERGQVTIPKDLRDRYGLNRDVEVEFVPEENGLRIQKRARKKHPIDEIYGIAKLRYASTVDEYIEEIRGR